MRFSIWPSPMRPWQETLELTRHCETTGWDGVYFADHFMPGTRDSAEPEDGRTLECWSVVAGLAAAVPRLRLGTLVSSVTYRHPAVLANIAATVDHISEGRLLFGVGAGWQQNEHDAYGIRLGSVKERLDRLEEAVQVLRGLLGQQRTTFGGVHYRITDAPNDPKPIQQPLPLLIGGGGETRTMRIAAEHADEWNVWSTPEVLAHKRRVLHAHCEDIGREPGQIAISTQALVFLSNDESWLADKRGNIGRPTIVGTPAEVVDIVGQYGDAGCDELIIPDWTMGSLQRRIDTCNLFIEQVAPGFR